MKIKYHACQRPGQRETIIRFVFEIYVVRSKYTEFNSSACCQRSIRTVAAASSNTPPSSVPQQNVIAIRQLSIRSTMRSILASLLLALSVHGKELEVSNWITPPRSDVPYYPELSADVGDTIVFTWNGMSQLRTTSELRYIDKMMSSIFTLSA